MFAFIDKVESTIQKVFDTAVFFLMRRFGWEKSFMRRSLWHIIVANWAAYAILMPERADRAPRFVCVATNIGLALAYFAYMSWRYRSEDRTNWRRSGAILSPIDADRLPWVWAWKLWSILLYWDALLFRPDLAITDSFHRTSHLMSAVFVAGIATATLLEAYLVKTPDQPPPLEERKATLVPAAVRI